MHRSFWTYLGLGLLAAAWLSSCSTVKVLQEGERRLVSNKIEVTNDKKFNTEGLQPYIKQKSKGWNPFLYVYNWQNGEGKGWDRFVKKLGTPPVIFDEELVGSSAASILEHLEYIGYYNSDIQTVIDDSKAKKAKVRYIVTLGKRYKINDVSFELESENIEFRKDFFADTLKTLIKRGDYLSQLTLENESVRSEASLHNKGFYDFSKNFYFFEADTVSVPSEASLKVIVKRHTRNESDDISHEMYKYRFGRVSITSPNDVKFRTKALKRLNVIKSGELYSDTKVNLDYSRYSSINYINSVNVQLTPREGQRLVDCDIQINKGKTQGFKFGLEASISTSGLWGISPELSYYHRNIFHGGEILNVSVNTNHQLMNGKQNVMSNEVTASASLSFPKVFPIPNSVLKGPEIPRTEVKIAYNYQNRPEFIRNMLALTYGYTGNVDKKFTYQAYPLSVNTVYLPFINPDFWETIAKKNPYVTNSFNNHFDMGISGIFQYATGTVVNPKDNMWYTRLSTDISGNFLSLFNSYLPVNASGARTILNIPYSQYVRMEFTLGGVHFFGKDNNHAIAGRILVGLGYGYGNSRTLPFEKRFYSGGANSLRGWSAKTLGPGTSPLSQDWAIPNQTGDMKLEANLEYRFKIFWKLYGAAFVDAGNVWEVGEPAKDEDPGWYFSFANLKNSIAASWGIGLRVDLNFLVLRVDYGMRFHDPARAEGDKWLGPADWFRKSNNAFHFGIGYPF